MKTREHSAHPVQLGVFRKEIVKQQQQQQNKSDNRKCLGEGTDFEIYKNGVDDLICKAEKETQSREHSSGYQREGVERTTGRLGLMSTCY